MAVDGAVQVGGLVVELSEATAYVSSDGGGVIAADVGIDLFHFQRFQGSADQLGGVSPAPMLPVGLQTFQQVAVLPLLQPQSGHITAAFLPNTANAIRKEILAEKAVEVLAFIQRTQIIHFRQGEYLQIGNISCNDQHVRSSRPGWTW